jgi:predicted  nucleic acid-binding Zn-ribbon protein
MGKTGRRIWFGIAIFLSGLVVLLSLAGIAGVWVFQQAARNTISNLVDSVISVTQNIQALDQSFDQKLENMQEIVSSISDATNTLSQQVANQGLISTLLPEEQTTNLANLSASVQESINTIRDTLTTVRSLYQTIDAIPFINLPSLSQDQIDQFNQSVTAIQTMVDNVNNTITAFRTGASTQIDKLTAAVDQLNSGLSSVRSLLAEVDNRLTKAQDTLNHLQQTIFNALLISSVIGTLLLLFVIYTQVEVIRLYVQRWRATSMAAQIGPATEQPQLADHPSTLASGEEKTVDEEKKE